jgi:hypothetical protein
MKQGARLAIGLAIKTTSASTDNFDVLNRAIQALDLNRALIMCHDGGAAEREAFSNTKVFARGAHFQLIQGATHGEHVAVQYEKRHRGWASAECPPIFPLLDNTNHG